MRDCFGRLPIDSPIPKNFKQLPKPHLLSPRCRGESKALKSSPQSAVGSARRTFPLARSRCSAGRRQSTGRPCPLPGQVLCESFLMLRLGERGPCSSRSSVAGSLPDDDSKSIRGSRGRSSISAAACSSNRPWRIGDRMLGREQSREPLGMRRSG